MDSLVAGIDLGGTKVEIALVDPHNHILAHRRILTQAEAGPEAAIERIAVCLAELEAEAGAGHAAAVGICAPGPLDHAGGTLINPTNLPRFYNLPLREMLARRLRLPVALEHDAKAAALGEFYYGAGSGDPSLVYTVVGTGVGSAIIVNGQLFRGLHNFAGEGGHTTIDPDGELCACGSRGCVETFTSGPWLARRYLRGLERQGRLPAAGQEIGGETVSRLAAQGDPLALEIMAAAGRALGIMVATLAMILDIELFVFGGSVPKCGDLLLEPARRAVPGYSFKSISSKVRIVPGQLGDEAPILGCVWLARQLLS